MENIASGALGRKQGCAAGPALKSSSQAAPVRVLVTPQGSPVVSNYYTMFCGLSPTSNFSNVLIKRYLESDRLQLGRNNERHYGANGDQVGTAVQQRLL